MEKKPGLLGGGIHRGHAETLFLILAVLSAVIIYWPFHNLIPSLPQGDRGRDFYVFQRTLHGDTPYRDYVWDYGPFSPYFYALFLKFFGASIPSVLLGELFLKILSGILIYFCLALFFELPLALMGSVWFWAFNPNFNHTNNHIAGIFGILLTLYPILRYLKNPEKNRVYPVFPGLLVTFLVKYNMGLSTFAAAVLSIFMIDTFSGGDTFTKRISRLAPFVFLLAAIAAVYAFIFRGLSAYRLHLCFPLLPEDRMFRILGLWKRLLTLFIYVPNLFRVPFVNGYENFSLPNRWMPAVASLLALWTVVFIGYGLKIKETISVSKKKIAAALAVLGLFSLFSLHEFLLTVMNYRIFWVTPIFILAGFFICGAVFRYLPWYVKVPLFFLLGLTACVKIQEDYVLKENTAEYASFFYLPDKNAMVYVNNQVGWVGTVRAVADYLKNHLRRDEMFLAVPYESLYYYLLDRKSPIPENCLFEFFHIPTEREQQMITDLEKEKVNYVLLSNRTDPSTTSFGRFGLDYCPVLAQYLFSHFEKVKTFGNWKNTGDWINDHAVTIYRRKIPLA